jgi:putative component of toxin-antitoxin plasmid stabilization module
MRCYDSIPSLSLFTGDVTVKRRASSSSDNSGSINISTGTSNYGFRGDIKPETGDGLGHLRSDRGGGSTFFMQTAQQVLHVEV